MKYLENFNLEINKNDLIVVAFPTATEATSLIIDKATRDKINKEFPYARPLVVAKVGENVGKDETTMELKRGDMVFIKEEFKHSAILLGFDPERRWKNPIIVPAYAIAAKVIYTEEYEADYTSIADRIEENIKLRQEKIIK
jgi:hypothetical protein